MNREEELKGLKQIINDLDVIKEVTSRKFALLIEKEDLEKIVSKPFEFYYPEKRFKSAEKLKEKLRKDWEKSHKLAFKFGKRYTASEEDLKLVAEAQKKDEEDTNIYLEQERVARNGAVKKYKKEHDPAEARLVELEGEISKVLKEIDELNEKVRANKFIAPKDLDRRTVSSIIDLIETHRADSIKEALNLYDSNLAIKKANDIAAQKVDIERQRLEAEKEAMREQLNIQKNYQQIEKQKLENEKEHQRNVESQMREDTETRARIANTVQLMDNDIRWN